MGASYGSLLAIKLLFAGNRIKLVCLPAEAEAINKEGARVRLPVKGRKELIEIDSRNLPGTLSADGPGAVNPADYDLVALAMQEPQYRSPGVRELLSAIARSLHVDHEHAAAALSQAHPRPRHRRTALLLHRCHRLGGVRSQADDAVQPGPAGVPPAGRKDQRAAGHAADQFQGGAL